MATQIDRRVEVEADLANLYLPWGSIVQTKDEVLYERDQAGVIGAGYTKIFTPAGGDAVQYDSVPTIGGVTGFNSDAKEEGDIILVQADGLIYRMVAGATDASDPNNWEPDPQWAGTFTTATKNATQPQTQQQIDLQLQWLETDTSKIYIGTDLTSTDGTQWQELSEGAVVPELTTPDLGKTAPTATYGTLTGQLLQAAIVEHVPDTPVLVTDIIDNRTSTDTDKPVSANQSKLTKDELDAFIAKLRADIRDTPNAVDTEFASEKAIRDELDLLSDKNLDYQEAADMVTRLGLVNNSDGSRPLKGGDRVLQQDISIIFCLKEGGTPANPADWVIDSVLYQLEDYIAAIGTIRTGADVGLNNNNLTLMLSGGEMIKYDQATHKFEKTTIAAQDPLVFDYIKSDGVTVAAAQTLVDVTQWDNAGTLEGVTDNDYSVQRLYIHPDGRKAMMYGQELYFNLTNVRQEWMTETIVLPAALDGYSLAAVMIVQENDTTSSVFRLIESSRFGEVTSASGGLVSVSTDAILVPDATARDNLAVAGNDLINGRKIIVQNDDGLNNPAIYHVIDQGPDTFANATVAKVWPLPEGMPIAWPGNNNPPVILKQSNYLNDETVGTAPTPTNENQEYAIGVAQATIAEWAAFTPAQRAVIKIKVSHWSSASDGVGGFIWVETQASAGSKPRAFITETAIAPAIATQPSISEVEAWAALDAENRNGTLAVYDGTDIEVEGVYTHVWSIDTNGKATILEQSKNGLPILDTLTLIFQGYSSSWTTASNLVVVDKDGNDYIMTDWSVVSDTGGIEAGTPVQGSNFLPPVNNNRIVIIKYNGSAQKRGLSQVKVSFRGDAASTGLTSVSANYFDGGSNTVNLGGARQGAQVMDINSPDGWDFLTHAEAGGPITPLPEVYTDGETAATDLIRAITVPAGYEALITLPDKPVGNDGDLVNVLVKQDPAVAITDAATFKAALDNNDILFIGDSNTLSMKGPIIVGAADNPAFPADNYEDKEVQRYIVDQAAIGKSIIVTGTPTNFVTLTNFDTGAVGANPIVIDQSSIVDVWKDGTTVYYQKVNNASGLRLRGEPVANAAFLTDLIPQDYEKRKTLDNGLEWVFELGKTPTGTDLADSGGTGAWVKQQITLTGPAVEHVVFTRNRDQTMVFGDLNFNVPTSGGSSLRMRMGSGSMTITNFSTFWSNQQGGASEQSPSFTLGTSWRHFRSGLNLTQHNNYQEGRFVANGWAYRVQVIVGLSWNNNRFTMTRWRLDAVKGDPGIDGVDGVDASSIDHISQTAGDSSPGTTDTYTLWADAGETVSLGTYDVPIPPAIGMQTVILAERTGTAFTTGQTFTLAGGRTWQDVLDEFQFLYVNVSGNNLFTHDQSRQWHVSDLSVQNRDMAITDYQTHGSNSYHYRLRVPSTGSTTVLIDNDGSSMQVQRIKVVGVK